MTPRHPSPRMTTVEHDGATEDAVALPIAGDRSRSTLFWSGVSTLLGAALLLRGETVMGGLTVAVFGLGTVKHLRGGDARPSVMLAASGLVIRSPFGAIAVPWDAVTAVSERTVSGARYVEVEHDGRVRRGPLLRLARRLGLGSRDRVWVPLERVDADPDAVSAAIVRLYEDPGSRARIATGELARGLAADPNLTPASSL
jgi:hypothetical protein